ncbi:MAG: galactose-1-phosphate uridylyltransferase [Candidatus Pacebacteria bacterium]|nr:galactose-1-phosphate uridylyltransferase [Candidatus Paceibacterota bacterium]
MKKNSNTFSELRRDLVSGTWVAFSTKRRARPDFHKATPRVSDNYDNPKDCLFCRENFDKQKQEKDTLMYLNKNGDWTIRVFPNKFPIFSSTISGLNRRDEGPFEIMDGVGYHEVLVAADHRKNFPDLEIPQIVEVFDAYQERYLALMNKRNVKYISIFKNYGSTAGASIVHPHNQIVAMPIIDPDVARSLDGSARYFQAHKECVHCVMLKWEIEKGERIIFENEDFVVLCPFVSRVSFEIRIYPKKHLSYFERITKNQKIKLSEAVRAALRKVKYNLDDPDYNMFLHTAPCDGQTYDHYHWHFEIFPKTNIWAGLELSTGIEVCSILPEEAAKILKKKSKN